MKGSPSGKPREYSCQGYIDASKINLWMKYYSWLDWLTPDSVNQDESKDMSVNGRDILTFIDWVSQKSVKFKGRDFLNERSDIDMWWLMHDLCYDNERKHTVFMRNGCFDSKWLSFLWKKEKKNWVMVARLLS